MSGKNVIIFGDSYSTFEGYIPEGYAVYYSGHDDRHLTDVSRVDETWWHRVIEQTGAVLVRNDSWSGSTVGYTGWEGFDNSRGSSFIFRLRYLVKQGFFEQNRIDTVFFFGATNDNWCGAPLGEEKWDDISESDLYFVLPAICEFFKELRDACPNAAIYGLINIGLKPEVENAIRAACERYGCTPIDFDGIDLVEGHPTVRGMREIADRVVSVVGEAR